MDIDELFGRVVQACPSFEGAVEEHIKDFDEVLPHLLMADIGRVIESGFTGRSTLGLTPPSQDEIRAVLAVLEEGLADGDETVDNVISVSFLENLWIQARWEQLKPLLGPTLAAEVAEMQAWTPP